MRFGVYDESVRRVSAPRLTPTVGRFELPYLQ